VDEETIGRMIADCLPAAPDAITILCTNMIGARVAADMETPDGPMMLDTVAVTLWACLMALGLRPDLITGQGRLFTEPRINP
jgi:maleate isomerase